MIFREGERVIFPLSQITELRRILVGEEERFVRVGPPVYMMTQERNEQYETRML